MKSEHSIRPEANFESRLIRHRVERWLGRLVLSEPDGDESEEAGWIIAAPGGISEPILSSADEVRVRIGLDVLDAIIHAS